MKNMKKIVIIGGGIAGLECAKTLVENGYTEVILLERNNEIIRSNSWKTFERTVKRFELEDCIASKIEEIYQRTIDIDTSEIMVSSYRNLKAVVLDSKKVYAKILQNIKSYVKTNTEVEKIERNQTGYKILTTNGTFEADIIVDASGVEYLTENLLSNKEFKSNAFYMCYGKRYTNCNISSVKDKAIFDNHSVFKLFGGWCYPVNDNTVEIGVGRLTNSFEMNSEEVIIGLEELLTQYKKLEPFNKMFDNADHVETISGYCSLLPRTKLKKENVYIIGDAKGAVPFSGYGVENALESGRQCALSIIKNKKYKYFVTSPSRGIAGLKAMWGLNMKEIRDLSSGITTTFSDKRAFQFYTGKMTVSFFIDCFKIARKNNIKLMKHLSIGLVLRAIFNLKPKKKHYASFLKMGIDN